MLTFDEFLGEAVHNKNYSGTDYSSRWNDDKESVKLVDSIDGYDIYINSSDTYYIVKNGVYFGHVSITDRGDNISIDQTYSKIGGGFYAMVIPMLFKLTKAKEIFSDFDLSTAAIKAYEKLYATKTYDITIVNSYNKHIPFTVKDLLKTHSNNISIKQKV